PQAAMLLAARGTLWLCTPFSVLLFSRVQSPFRSRANIRVGIGQAAFKRLFAIRRAEVARGSNGAHAQALEAHAPQRAAGKSPVELRVGHGGAFSQGHFLPGQRASQFFI